MRNHSPFRIPHAGEFREYAQPIYEYLREAENNPKLRVTDPNFLEKQEEISARMRGILLDWLVEVHYKFKLAPETLYNHLAIRVRRSRP